ncbi:3-isopropylmalate dehydratase large subunit [Halorarius halobius]|uniref:3-isopropylmalate dehydratase large subunit n=1 Tax=Halorarius halobius TaxID=2962671 RepID=UPI0020CE234C|nr:3-isopropylmalate dehydratase large subunit [Halorarius halobius]
MTTISEQILSEAAGEPVSAGDIVRAPVDFTFGNDISLPPAIEEFQRFDDADVFDGNSVGVFLDHLYPAHTEHAAELHESCRAFAEAHDCILRAEQEHAVVAEEGFVGPGDVMVASDSHTCTAGALGAFATGVGSTDLAFILATGWAWLRVPETTHVEFTGTPGEWVEAKDLTLAAIGELGVDGAIYHALEFSGEAVRSLSMDERFTLTNMAIEAGAKTGIVEPDEVTEAYAREHYGEEFETYVSGEDATFANEVTVDCDGLEPQVAVPSSPANNVDVSDVQAEGIEIDQAVVGSCTNGRASDLRRAAEILEGRSVADGVRLIVTPATERIQSRSLDEGWTETFLDAGAVMENPGCGACFGQRTGILGPDEVAVSTTNRNFTGRMGDPSSEVYLASPSVAAASAVAGRIVHPEEVA